MCILYLLIRIDSSLEIYAFSLSAFGAPWMLDPPLIGTLKTRSRSVSCRSSWLEPPFILYFASTKCPADSYSERNKRCLSSPASSIWPFSPSFSLYPMVSRKRIAAPRKLLPLGLLLHSALFAPVASRTPLSGLFFLREPLPALRERTLFFFLVPVPPSFLSTFSAHRAAPSCTRGSFSQLLSLFGPFLPFYPETQSPGDYATHNGEI